MIPIRGLTWDHPRGYQALRAAAARARAEGLAIDWDIQPLEGFESAPIAELAAAYDLIVMDHPHVGEAVKAGCLRPLDAVFQPAFLARLEAEAMGPAFRSYLHAGRPWALPLDAATQVAASRPDLLPEPPATWEAALDRAARAPMALCLAGPHAILSFLSIAAALGEPPARADPDLLVSPQTGRAVLGLMRALHALRAPGTDALNPIGILDAMASGADLAFCPLIYGYVPYATPAPGRHPIRFTDAPAASPGGRPGSTLGGTGIALSARSEPPPALLAHLQWLMSPEAQTGFIPAQAGQPGLRVAWEDDAVNAASADFYRQTARTLDAAYVRPRHPGWIAFQTEASAMLREGLASGATDADLLSRIQGRYAISRAGGEET